MENRGWRVGREAEDGGLEWRSSVPSMAREGARAARHRFSMEFEGGI